MGFTVVHREWEVYLHDGVALGNHVLLVERLRPLVWVAVDADVLHSGSRVVACPEEVVSLLVLGKFLGGIKAAGEDLPSQVVCDLGVLFLQLLDEAVHLGACQEIDNLLLVVDAELAEVLQAGAVEGEHNLIHRKFVAHEVHTGAGELRLVDVDHDDVADDAERIAEVPRFDLHDAEGALALWQTGHIGVEDVEEGTSGRSFPGLLVHDDKHLIGAACCFGNEIFFLATGNEQHAKEDDSTPDSL